MLVSEDGRTFHSVGVYDEQGFSGNNNRAQIRVDVGNKVSRIVQVSIRSIGGRKVDLDAVEGLRCSGVSTPIPLNPWVATNGGNCERVCRNVG